MPLDTQVFALLFKCNGLIGLAAEDTPSPGTLEVTNNERGLNDALAWFGSRTLANRIPLLCCCPAPGAVLEGLFFEELVSSDEVRRFLLPAARLHEYAQSTGESPHEGKTLIAAYRQVFPRASTDA